MKRRYMVIISMLLIMVCAAPAALAAPAGEFACLGADLSDSQRAQVLEKLGATSSTQLLTVTIDDERALLSGLVDASKIGSRSLSSVLVRLKDEGSGISVTTYNINWVTPTWYQNALITAGVKDAEVIVAAPVEVSGTAALAGIFKAYETAVDTKLLDVAKKLAGEELVTTGELADALGSDQAAQLIATLKEQLIINGWDTPEKIKDGIRQYQGELGVSLTDSQIEMLSTLLYSIGKLDLDPKDLAEQVKSLGKLVESAQKIQENTNSALKWIGEVVSGISGWFKGLFGGN